MNLSRSIKQTEKDLKRKRVQMRKAKAINAAGFRMDCEDLQEKLNGLLAQQRQQDAWRD